MSEGIFTDRHVLVMGLGRFGGGIGVTRWMCAQGARVTVTDAAKESDLAESVQRLSECSVTFRFGGHDSGDLDGIDLAVVSPAVDRRRSRFFAQIVERDIPWTTEINLFLERCRGRVMGVTGTAGKSTTCAMIHHVLAEANPSEARVWFGGNVGRSLLGELSDIRSDDLVVLELSSFQLESTPQIRWSPPVAVVTNAWPNHLDRHVSVDEYIDVKLNLLRHQRPGDSAVLGCADPELERRVLAITESTGATLIRVTDGPGRYDLRLAGEHNQANAACAATVAELLGVDDAVIRRSLTGFAGLPHRLEHVASIAGVDYINDSKSTTPKATATALAAFDRPVVAILGGQERDDDVSEMVGHAIDKARAVICTGASGLRIAAAIKALRDTATKPAVSTAADVQEAVDHATRLALPGDVVLLSPGAPSYGQFVNYEQRGDAFRDAVQAVCGTQELPH